MKVMICERDAQGHRGYDEVQYQFEAKDLDHARKTIKRWYKEVNKGFGIGSVVVYVCTEVPIPFEWR